MDGNHRGHGVVLSDQDRELICEALTEASDEERELADHLLRAW